MSKSGKKEDDSQEFVPSIKKRIKGFDELRGIAIILVLIAHWGMVWPSILMCRMGPIGVDVFFVVSGYLIGFILYDKRGDTGYFRNFYIRRVFRILPLAFAVILFGVCSSLLFGRSIDSLIYYITCTQNYIPAFLVSNQNSSGELLPLIGTDPMRSLAVEEHVYILLPVIVYFSSKRLLPYVIMFIAIVGAVCTAIAYSNYGGGWYTNYNETWNRMHLICYGVLLCRPQWRYHTISALMLWLVVGLLINGIDQVGQWSIGVIICLVVFLLSRGLVSIDSRILRMAGKLCYGIYLLHYPIVIVCKELYHRGVLDSLVSQIICFLAYLILSVLLAALSFKYFEMPIQRQRGRFEKTS